MTENTDTANVTRRYNIEVAADVHGADVRDAPYTAKPTHYRPTHIRVTYNWTSEDTGQTAHVELNGPVVLKDGRDGRSKRESLWSKDDWPDWVSSFVTANRPRTGAA